MTVALGTLILFLLLLPGLVFFRMYYSGVFSKQFIRTTPFEVFYMSLTPGIIFQFVGILLINKYSEYYINLRDVGQLLGGALPREINVIFGDIQNSLPQIIIYNVSLCVIAGFLGLFALFIVRKLKLDRRFKLFRFQNNWHYLLNDELREIPSIKNNIHQTKSKEEFLATVYIDALMEINSENVLYKGVLTDYLLSKAGGLELLYLSNAKRKVIGVDSEYVIPGDYLVLKYNEIKNLNVTYKYKQKKSWLTKEVTQVLVGLLIVFGIPLLVAGLIYFNRYTIGILLGLLYVLGMTLIIRSSK